MNRMCKLVAAMLAGVLSAAALASCNGENAVTTTDVTTATTAQPDAEQIPTQGIVSPQELYNLLLNTSDFTVESQWTRKDGGDTTHWKYSMKKDGDVIVTDYTEQKGTDQLEEEINFADLGRSRYYEIVGNDWLFYSLENTFFADGVSAFLYDLSPMDGKRLWKDESYEPYDPENRRYRVKDSVLEEVFAENGWPQPPSQYLLTYTEQSGEYRFVYSWREGEASMSMRTIIRCEENNLELPTAENDQIAETPYTGEAMDAMLTGLRKIDLSTEMVQFYTVNFNSWEGEEAERLFDGIKTKEQWYYNEDGSLKENAFPELGKGGGPGKCAGMIGDYTQFVFCFPTKTEISAYVLTNANDNEEFGHRTPVRWSIYATNDACANDPDTAIEAEWVLIDYVWEGGMQDENFFSGGYRIDSENCDRYYCYCLEIQAVSGYQFQLGEIEFYIDY